MQCSNTKLTFFLIKGTNAELALVTAGHFQLNFTYKQRTTGVMPLFHKIHELVGSEKITASINDGTISDRSMGAVRVADGR